MRERWKVAMTTLSVVVAACMFSGQVFATTLDTVADGTASTSVTTTTPTYVAAGTTVGDGGTTDSSTCIGVDGSSGGDRTVVSDGTINDADNAIGVSNTQSGTTTQISLNAGSSTTGGTSLLSVDATNSGTVKVAIDSAATANGDVNQAGGVLNICGAFTGGLNISGGTYSAGCSIGKTTVTGNVSLGAAAKTLWEIGEGTTGGVSADQIEATGNVTIAAGHTLEMLPVGYVAAGQQNVLIQADSDNTGDALAVTLNSVAVTEDSAVLAWALSTNDGNNDAVDDQLIATASRVATYAQVAAAAGADENDQEILDSYHSVLGTAYGTTRDLLTAMDNMTAAEIKMLAEQLNPAPMLSATVTSNMEVAETFTDALVDRTMRQCEYSASGTYPYGPAGPSAEPLTGVGVWAQPIGVWGDQSDRRHREGYEWDTYGIVAGLDAAMGNGLVGISLGYTNTDIDSNWSGTDADTDTFQVGVYGTYMIEKLYIDAGFSWSGHSTEAERSINGTALGLALSDAEADFESDSYTGYVGLGYIHTSGNWTITPSAALAYSVYDQEGYTEEGAGAYILEYEEYDQDSFTSTLGVEVAYMFDNKVKWAFRANWTHEFADNEPQVHARAAGAGAVGSRFVEIEGLEPDDDAFFIGTGLTMYLTDHTTAFLNYDAELRNDYDAHTLSAGLRFDF